MAPDINHIFNRTSDNIISSKLGDVDQLRKTLFTNLDFHSLNYSKSNEMFREYKATFNALMMNESIKNKDNITTTESSVVMELTPKPTKQEENQLMEFLKLRMLRRELNAAFKEKGTYIPQFEKDDDDPMQLSRRFDIGEAEPSFEKFEELDLNETRRILYNGKERVRNHYAEKYRLAELMRQFIYMTRYKMTIMVRLRKKYMGTIKYKLGYLFGLYRMVKTQQRTMLSTLVIYFKAFNNPTLQHLLFYKIVKLDIDLDDLIRYIRRLDIAQKLLYWPTYFDDSSDYYDYKKPSPSPPLPVK